MSQWQKCPVCDGRGNVPNGFYNPYGLGVTNSLSPEKCRTCAGYGVIQEPGYFEIEGYDTEAGKHDA